MFSRWSKIILVGCYALFFTLVVMNNLTDYGSNFLFVSNVLSMTDTFTEHARSWRSIHAAPLHHLAYWGIILTEMAIMLLAWVGCRKLWMLRMASVEDFQAGKQWSVISLTLGMILWFAGFISIGGEFFLMWQSVDWNGNPTAYRNAMLTLLLLIYVNMREV